MLKACIEKIHNGESYWVSIPNGDLHTAVYDFVGDNDWEVAIVTGLKEDGITSFVNNVFHKVDSIFELNDLIVDLETNFHFDSNDIENLAFLNLLMEDRNCDIEDVSSIIRNDRFKIYHNVEDMGDVAREYLENNYSWYEDAENEINFSGYFDFKSYGEDVLGSSGNWLQDKNYKIIVEVFE